MKKFGFPIVMILLSAFIQLIPFITSEKWIYFTIFSAVPVYYMARKNLFLGIMTYLISAAIVFIFSSHEAMMYLFTNGLIGLSLGVLTCLITDSFKIILLSSVKLTFALCILNFLVGIQVFGTPIEWSLLNGMMIFVVACLYVSVCFSIFSIAFKRIKWTK